MNGLEMMWLLSKKWDELKKDDKYNKKDEPLLINIINSYLQNLFECFMKDAKEGKLSKEFGEELSGELREKLREELKNTCIKSELLMGKIESLYEQFMENHYVKSYLVKEEFYKNHKIERKTLKDLNKEVSDKIANKLKDDNKEVQIWICAGEQYNQNVFESFDDFLSNQENDISLEIITTEVLNYDDFIFDILGGDSQELKDIIKEIYCPYIMEFCINTEILDEEKKKFINEIYNNSKIFKATLDTDAKNQTNMILLKGTLSASLDYDIFQTINLYINKNPDEQIEHEIEKIYKNSINYLQTNKDENISCFMSSDTNNININNIFKNIRVESVDVYKVGNGNLIYNNCDKDGNKCGFFYDIGFDRYVGIGKNPIYNYILEKIKDLNPMCIILSHWDTDHFRLYKYWKGQKEDVIFIAPEIKEKNKFNARRLFEYLELINNMECIKRQTETLEINLNNGNDNKISLYMGHGGNDEKITLCNREGIALYIENKIYDGTTLRCMMHGDVPYSSLQQIYGNNSIVYDYLVAPHHGAAMDCSMLPYISISESDKGNAIICCDNNKNGKRTIKNRPEKNHKERLEENYKVLTTEEANNYIELCLEKKLCVKK